MTPEQALQFLDSIAAQCLSPALNRSNATKAVEAVQLLRQFIKDNTCTGEGCKIEPSDDQK